MLIFFLNEMCTARIVLSCFFFAAHEGGYYNKVKVTGRELFIAFEMFFRSTLTFRIINESMLLMDVTYGCKQRLLLLMQKGFQMILYCGSSKKWTKIYPTNHISNTDRKKLIKLYLFHFCLN